MSDRAGPPPPPWHALTGDAALARLEARPGGLTTAEAEERRRRHGANVLPHRPPPTRWVVLLRQFQSPLIYILALAAAVSVAIGHAQDAGFIAAVLLLNATIGGWQEWRAEQSSRALQKLLAVHARVERDGNGVVRPAEDLVPGDVVWLESGGQVPADLRLLEAQGLEIDESLLTGESVPVPKDAGFLGDAATALSARRNLAFAGSSVARGRARGLVVETGARTLVGQLARDVMHSRGGRPPLLERMERFTRLVAYVVLGAALVIGALGVFVRGYGAGDMFLFAVALAVSAIPEGLPVALTVALAIATTRMARRGVIVRRLAAVEGLGSCTLIASDKTGTLTCNELTVRVVLWPDGTRAEVSGEGYAPEGEVHGKVPEAARAALARVAALCNEARLWREPDGWRHSGDPTDVALLSLAVKLGTDPPTLRAALPAAGAIPFEPERRYAASFHLLDGDTHAFVKGAPERVLGMCALDEAARAVLLAAAEALARQGYRVLGFAAGPAPTPVPAGAAPAAGVPGEPADPTDLGFVGFVGMIDPLRPGAREAVAACQAAGIAVSMITGDHPVTALAIARELGFAHRPEEVVTGRELDGLAPEALVRVVGRARVFARTTPRQKLELVRAARQAGHFVAVTGDGVNDAPALREANIGVAMGRSGTDVAREAAELVITDDDFSTLVAGIEEGRVAYDNIRKVVYLLVSTGAAEILVLGLSILTGWPDTAAGWAVLPLLPVQILWMNLVTNGIQDVALAFEPAEGAVLRRPPRPPRQRIFDRLMVERVLVAAGVMSAVSFGAFVWMIEGLEWSEAESRNALLLLMVLFQNLHVGNCRSESESIFRLSPLRSPVLLTGTLLAFLTHLVAMHLPLTQRLLSVGPVDAATFGILFLLALSITVAMEVHKAWWRRRTRPPGGGQPGGG